jgi:hypothetical protein
VGSPGPMVPRRRNRGPSSFLCKLLHLQGMLFKRRGRQAKYDPVPTWGRAILPSRLRMARFQWRPADLGFPRKMGSAETSLRTPDVGENEVKHLTWRRLQPAGSALLPSRADQSVGAADTSVRATSSPWRGSNHLPRQSETAGRLQEFGVSAPADRSACATSSPCSGSDHFPRPPHKLRGRLQKFGVSAPADTSGNPPSAPRPDSTLIS